METLKRIKRLRIDKGFSQEHMAFELEIGQSNYNRLERGINKLSADRLKRIAGVLNVSVDLLTEPPSVIKPQFSETTIEICQTCKGEGKTPNIPEHDNDEAYFLETCRNCQGSGRLKIKITKTVEPFKPNK